MTDARILTEHGFPCSPRALAAVLAVIGPIVTVEDLPGGVVHHVARVTGAGGRSVVLKRRGDACWALPERPLRPADASFEARALELLDQARPGLAPGLLCYDEAHATIVMTDLGDYRYGSGAGFLARASPGQAMAAIASAAVTLAGIHSRLATSFPATALRPDGDEEIFERNLYERIGYHDRLGTSRLVAQVRLLERQLILGDFSPKNIRFDGTSIRVFDLEHVHLGARVFDLAFLLSHVIVHRGAVAPALASAEVHHAARLYQQRYPLGPDSRRLLDRLVASGILYRIRNQIVPYDTPFSPEAKARFANALLNGLESPGLTIGDIMSAVPPPSAPASQGMSRRITS